MKYNLIKQVENISYELAVDNKVVDIDDYIPFQSTEDILSFCSAEDGLLAEKKTALRKRIHACGDQESHYKFVTSLVKTFFEPGPLVGTHKWPYKK